MYEMNANEQEIWNDATRINPELNKNYMGYRQSKMAKNYFELIPLFHELWKAYRFKNKNGVWKCMK